MMKIIKGLMLIGFLFVMPIFSGAAVTPWDNNQRKYWIGNYVSGYLLAFAVFEIFCIPAIFLGMSLHLLGGIYLAVMMVCSFVGLLRLIQRRSDLAAGFARMEVTWNLYGALAVLMIAAETMVPVLFLHSDLDDSFFVATAETTLYTNSLFRFDAYTGLVYESLPARYVLAPFQIWNALASWISGVTPAVIAHTVFPLFLIPMCFGVFYLIGCEFFPEKRKEQSLFLLLIACMFAFSYDSIYSVGTFLMIRIWQGKAILAAGIMPYIFLLSYRIMVQKEDGARNWLLLLTAMFAGFMVSTMGVMLPVFIVALFALYYGLFLRNWPVLLRSICCCLPNLVFAVLYLVLKG